MSTFTCYKNTKENIDNIEIKDGQMLVATDEACIYFDHKGERIKIKQGTTIQSTDDIEEGENNKYDKTVNLTPGNGISITGTYPNFEITSTNTGSSSSSSGNGFSLLTRFCVNYGKMDLVNYIYSPYLFNTDLDFFIDEENPLLVTFANGKTKLFTSYTNIVQENIDLLTTGEEGEEKRYLIYIDEAGNIDYLKIGYDYYKAMLVNSLALPYRCDKALYTEIYENDYIDSYERDMDNDVWVQKSFVFLGELVVSSSGKKAITYEYNKNALSDSVARQTFRKLEVITGDEVTPTYSQRDYYIKLDTTKTLLINLPEITYTHTFKENCQYLAQFNLIVNVVSESAELNLKSLNDYPILISGDAIGSKGRGKYLIELYKDLGDYGYYGCSRYLGKLYEVLPPPVNRDDEGDIDL